LPKGPRSQRAAGRSVPRRLDSIVTAPAAVVSVCYGIAAVAHPDVSARLLSIVMTGLGVATHSGCAC
jgi:hypothetical protein